MRPRNLLFGLLVLGFISTAPAQLIKPVEGSGESVGSDETEEQPKKRAPVLAAKWPFKFGKKLFGKEEATDPFLVGASAQRQLATELTGRNGIAVSPPPPQQQSAAPLVPGSSYPWPAPVDTRPQVVIPAGASSNTTWQSAPTEANAAGQLPSGMRQSPASAAIAQAPTATSPTAPWGQRFSHFAASNAKNPPPAAVPIPPGRPSVPSSVAANSGAPSTPASANVPAAALMPDMRPDTQSMASTATAPGLTPPSSAAPTNDPPPVVAPTAKPTTLAAGPPARPPADQLPPGMRASNVQTLSPPMTAAATRPTPAAGQFAVEKMDQDIWGPPLAKPTPTPASTQNRGADPNLVAGSRPSSVAPSVPSPPPAVPSATAKISLARDGDFVPAGPVTPQSPGAVQLQPSTSPLMAPPPTFAPRPTSPPNSSASRTVVPPEQNLATSGGRAAAPFDNRPNVVLLDSPVISESSPPAANAMVHGTLDEGTRVLAIVGDQSILAGDVLGQVNEMLAPYRDQASEMELAYQREKIIQEMLPRLIERKLIFYDFLQQIPVDKLPELEQQVFKHFNEKRLPEILEKTGLQSGAELDAKLRGLGSSLANQQRLFFEQMVAAEAVQREARGNEEVSHDEMLAYYNKHLADYSFPAKVRWERLAVEPSRFATPEQAYNALARMGNEVFHGANFADVARRSSQGPKAAGGGQYDWTTQGSLVNKEIDRLLFMLPKGQLSKVVKGDSMYQILRVIERVEAGTRPFVAVQNEITEKIKKQRFEERVEAYVARLREETYVWSSTSGDAATTQVAQPASAELER